MKFSIFQNPLNSWQGSSLLLGIFEEDIYEQISPLHSIINKDLLFEKIKKKNFKGEQGQKVNLDLLDHELQSLSIIGLGKKNNFDNDSFNNFLSAYIRTILDKEEKLSILLPWDDLNKNIIFSTSELIRLSAYKDNRFNNKRDEKNILQKIEYLKPNEIQVNFKEVEDICEGVEFARRLVSAPPNSLTPFEMARQAIEIAKVYELEVQILDKKKCEELKMGAFLAVAKGSDLEPQFIHLTYKPKDQEITEKIAFVGKGLTFDSGGYNLKVGASQIEMMKYDMGGSATVLGTAKAIGAIKPKGLEIHFIVASCENMINGSAVHPGDVVTASNGKTIEINNTDAEGRLTLADALIYASNLKPKTIIDLATLTGACVVALGNDVAGMWSNDSKLAKELLDCASECGEGLWQMPLQKSYQDGLKSHIADLKNTGPRAGGSITAALFLEEFLDNNINWAHIDIAGTCWTDKNKGINPSGATGYGVRTLVKWIKSKERI